MAAKIDAWLDCNSFYSRFALLHLRRYAKQLKQNGVEYEIHPVFINGLNAGSGNKPPWMLPAKKVHGQFDGQRATKYFGTNPMKAPPEFPINTLMTLRSLCYVKTAYDKDKFERVFLEMWTAIWEDGLNIGKPEILASVYQRHFSHGETETILKAAADPQWKSQLTQNTELALKKGAYGAPWFWVKNSRGDEEPFFGSDRFHYMWQYLDIPHRDFEVLGSSAKL